mmetsp:Transcript_44709/g.121861  ORF Transcript_44709/g.121861 Transcript_44709/m.121861 type:complete len:166 (+) Transcript_44709:1020-1517(+)
MFDEVQLNETSAKAIEALGDHEEVVVLMPADEFIIRHGPKRTVLYSLCRDVGLTEAINGFLDDVKVPCSYLALLGLASILALAELVPYELTWLCVLWLPDAIRRLFKCNTEAVGLVVLELDFWMPFSTMCLGCFFASASFNHEMAFATFSALFVISTTANILLGK